MRILNYESYKLSNDLMDEFIDHLSESNNNGNLDSIKSTVTNLNLNTGLVDMIGDYTLALYPIFNQLLVNSKLNIELSETVITLVTLTTVCVFYLEEYKGGKVDMMLTYSDADAFRNDIRFLLEELKMSGIGNGIVKKLSECVNAVSKIVKLLFDGGGLFDQKTKIQFGKICNSINFMINNHKMNMDTLIDNFTIVSDGISSPIAKKGMSDIMKKLNIKIDQVQDAENTIIDIDNMVDPNIGDVILENDDL